MGADLTRCSNSACNKLVYKEGLCKSHWFEANPPNTRGIPIPKTYTTEGQIRTYSF